MADSALIWGWFAMMTRWAPLVFGVGTSLLHWVPLSIRLVLLLSLTLVSLSVQSQLPEIANIGVALWLLASELLIGLLLLFQLQLLLALAGFWGKLLDQQIGFAAAGLLNPATKEMEPLLLSGLILALATMFFSLGLHQNWISLLKASYQWLPLGQVIDHTWFFRAAMGAGVLFVASVSLAAPFIVALWLFDVLAAVLSRNLPQMNIYFVAMPLKIMVGLSLVSLVIQHFAGFFRQLNDVALRAAHSWIS